MRLKDGDEAKNFSLKDISGKQILLSDFKDKKLMLSFYRYASCPLCNLRVQQLIQIHDELKSKGLFLVAFFQSPKESISKYVGKQNAPFPVISDPERKIYKLYGVEHSWIGYLRGGVSLSMLRALWKGFMIGKMEGKKNLLPADFLIDNLKVKKAYYGKTISDHLPIDKIKEFLI
ncbi:MAG: AhpC/TSA family protein [Candidatus Heimdallarchaeota archaeon]|nr:AhpC/TSA family protein [Candidatus Heimdallarchaeota archaeon]MCK4768810.1 AhpC/TSA family protein [Candidatus Heimdallarchaeota archaeon]